MAITSGGRGPCPHADARERTRPGTTIPPPSCVHAACLLTLTPRPSRPEQVVRVDDRARRPHEAELKRISSAIAPNTHCHPTCPGLWASARPSERALAPRSARAACVGRAGAGACRIADGRHDDRRIRSTGQRRRGRSGPAYVQRPDRTRRSASGSPRHSRGRSRSISLDGEPRPGEPRRLARYTPRWDQSRPALISSSPFLLRRTLRTPARIQATTAGRRRVSQNRLGPAFGDPRRPVPDPNRRGHRAGEAAARRAEKARARATRARRPRQLRRAPKWGRGRGVRRPGRGSSETEGSGVGGVHAVSPRLDLGGH
jgi:hypothetical protein